MSRRLKWPVPNLETAMNAGRRRMWLPPRWLGVEISGAKAARVAGAKSGNGHEPRAAGPVVSVSGQNYGKNACFYCINRFCRPRPVSGRPVCRLEHLLLAETSTPVVSACL